MYDNRFGSVDDGLRVGNRAHLLVRLHIDRLWLIINHWAGLVVDGRWFPTIGWRCVNWRTRLTTLVEVKTSPVSEAEAPRLRWC